MDEWNKLTVDPLAQNTCTAAPQANMGMSRQRCSTDAHPADLNTIRWYISGDTSYADCAIRICNAWSSTVNQVPTGTDIPGLSGTPIAEFAIVGELLRISLRWVASDFTRFKSMMPTYWYPVCHDFLTNHKGQYDLLRATTSGGPYTTTASWTDGTRSQQTDTGVTDGITYYYVLAAKNQSGTSGNSSQAGATPAAAGALPAGWARNDIGTTGGIASYASVGNNTFVVSGNSTDIGGTADSFTFAYQSMMGDSFVTARLLVDGSIKVGVIMRESTGTLQGLGGGYFRVINIASGKCLDPDGATMDGAQIHFTASGLGKSAVAVLSYKPAGSFGASTEKFRKCRTAVLLTR
jgi:hypothetical protein